MFDVRWCKAVLRCDFAFVCLSHAMSTQPGRRRGEQHRSRGSVLRTSKGGGGKREGHILEH